MPGMDHNGIFVVAAFVVTWLLLGGYLLYLRSRSNGLRGRLERHRQPEIERDAPTSTRAAGHAPI